MFSYNPVSTNNFLDVLYSSYTTCDDQLATIHAIIYITSDDLLVISDGSDGSYLMAGIRLVS